MLSNRELPAILSACDEAKNERKSRNIIICLDGTGDQYDNDNSNVVKFFAALKKDDPTQLCYYQSGVGTYSDSYNASLKSGFSAALDMAVGSSLGVHVREAYSFLMQNYCEGDKICIFGFSRGAYTARALAGMLYKVGLLPANNQAQIPFAYKWYKDASNNGWEMSAGFKRTFSIDVGVYFLGCWDTVASVGIIPRILPFAKTSNSSVAYFRHALALDERRAKFKANHWLQRDGKRGDSVATGSPADVLQQKSYEADTDADTLFHRALESHHQRKIETEKRLSDIRPPIPSFGSFGEVPLDLERNVSFGEETGKENSDDKDSEIAEDSNKEKKRKESMIRRNAAAKRKEEGKRQIKLMKEFKERNQREFGPEDRETDAMEVWFLGCHADCGGGAVANKTRHMLSRIPLRWMIRQTFACNTGILFHTDVLAEHGLDVDMLWPTLQIPKQPVADPPPSLLDRHEEKSLPTLRERRDATRRRMLGQEETQVEKGSTASSATATAHDWKNEKVLPEQYEDYFDALSRINDQLTDSKGWWILEFWPIKYRVKSGDDNWYKKVGFNLGRYRTVRQRHPKVHWTVTERQRVKGYKLQNALEDDVDWNVVC